MPSLATMRSCACLLRGFMHTYTYIAIPFLSGDCHLQPCVHVPSLATMRSCACCFMHMDTFLSGHCHLQHPRCDCNAEHSRVHKLVVIELLTLCIHLCSDDNDPAAWKGFSDLLIFVCAAPDV